MEYVTDLNETFRILSKCIGDPVYTTIDTDEEGNDVAVPMFKIGAADEKHRKERKVINYADLQNKRSHSRRSGETPGVYHRHGQPDQEREAPAADIHSSTQVIHQ